MWASKEATMRAGVGAVGSIKPFTGSRLLSFIHSINQSTKHLFIKLPRSSARSGIRQGPESLVLALPEPEAPAGDRQLKR